MLKAGRIAALDSTKNLLGSFSGLELRLRLDREQLPPAIGAAVLAHEGGRFTLRLRDYAELEEVLHRLRAAGVAIREFELQPPDLEEVFLRVMERH